MDPGNVPRSDPPKESILFEYAIPFGKECFGTSAAFWICNEIRLFSTKTRYGFMRRCYAGWNKENVEKSTDRRLAGAGSRGNGFLPTYVESRSYFCDSLLLSDEYSLIRLGDVPGASLVLNHDGPMVLYGCFLEWYCSHCLCGGFLEATGRLF